jgi:hypothetical protein
LTDHPSPVLSAQPLTDLPPGRRTPGMRSIIRAANSGSGR